MSRHQPKTLPARNQRLADQIQQDLAALVQRELPISRAGLITLTGVELTADYAHAKVYFTVLGAEPAAAKALLDEKAGWLHSQLFKLLHIHTIPTLHFLHDEQLSRGFAMNALIERANRPGTRADDVDAVAEPDDPDDSRG